MTKQNNLLPLNLQFFSDDDDEKKFTQAEFEEKLKERSARYLRKIDKLEDEKTELEAKVNKEPESKQEDLDKIKELEGKVEKLESNELELKDKLKLAEEKVDGYKKQETKLEKVKEAEKELGYKLPDIVVGKLDTDDENFVDNAKKEYEAFEQSLSEFGFKRVVNNGEQQTSISTTADGEEADSLEAQLDEAYKKGDSILAMEITEKMKEQK
ncbi:hypothetical protein ACKXGF_07480 [Alkalibacillus sp. S2W]|uniref:hypothetical protein n=1 Tax=Alkalibacillus sp. S2W TaxID=3386553 RepID=UPI00398C96AE